MMAEATARPLRASSLGSTLDVWAGLPRKSSKPALTAVLLSLACGGCAQNLERQASSEPRTREVGAFSHPKYGKASPRLVADGEPVPPGGGRDMIGRTYRVAGRSYTPRENPNYSATGRASWYGVAFQGRMTANGEIYDRHGFSAAHPTMPLPSYARVTNLANGHSIVVRVNDRGPYHGGRIIDVSQRTAEVLRFRDTGTATLKVDYIGRAHIAGSDGSRLLATLRTDGLPAQLPGGTPTATPVMLARAEERAVARGVAPPPAPVAIAPVQVAAAPASEPVAAPSTPAAPAGAVRLAAVPLPPERPFDLGPAPRQLVASLRSADRIAAAALPTRPDPRAADATIARRAQTAALFYAPATALDAPTRTFTMASAAMSGLDAGRFARLAPAQDLAAR